MATPRTPFQPTVWRDKEEEYLRHVSELCIHAGQEYNALYSVSKSRQKKLRLPAIILSSLTGVASFSSTSVPDTWHAYFSIGVGIMNVVIAMIATYEAYIGIAHIVSSSLSTTNGLKKLAEEIECEVFIPVEDRISDGITFIRDCFNRYQAILEQAPPLSKEATESLIKKAKVVKAHIRRCSQERMDSVTPRMASGIHAASFPNFPAIAEVISRNVPIPDSQSQSIETATSAPTA